MRCGSGGEIEREQTERVPDEGEEGREGTEVQAETEADAEGGGRWRGPATSTTDCYAEGEDRDGKRNGWDGDQSLFHFFGSPSSARFTVGYVLMMLDALFGFVVVVVVVHVLATSRKRARSVDSTGCLSLT